MQDRNLFKRWYLIGVLLPSISIANEISDFSVGHQFIDGFGELVPLLFRVYNYGILAVLSLLVGFSMMYAGAVAAAEGKGIARKINTWVFVRSVCGAGLLVPVGANDYAFIQKLVLKIVMISIATTATFLSSLSTLIVGANASGIDPSNYVEQLKKDVKLEMSYEPIVKAAYFAAMEEALHPGTVSIGTEQITVYYEACEKRNKCERIAEITIQPEYGNQRAQVEVIMAQAFERAMRSTRSAIPSLEKRVRGVLQGDVDALEGRIQTIIGFDEKDESPSEIMNMIPGFDKTQETYSPSEDCSQRSACWDNDAFTGVYQHFAKNAPKFMPSCVGVACDEPVITEATFESLMVMLPNLMDKMLIGAGKQSSQEVVVDELPPPGLKVSILKDNYHLVGLKALKKACKKSSDEFKCLKETFDQHLLYNTLRVASEQTDQVLYAQDFRANGPDRRQSMLVNDMSRIQDIINNLEQHKSGYSMPQDTPYFHTSKSALNVVPREMDKMFAKVLKTITGCDKDSCDNLGLFTFNKRSGSMIVNPIDYLTTLGKGFFEAGEYFAAHAVRGEEGVIAVDDDLTKRVYGSTTATLIAGKAAVSGLQMGWPFTTGWTRGGVFAASGVASNLIQLWGYLAELDQKILYKHEALGSSLAFMFMIWGAFFGIFLPLVPYMIVFFAVTGWLLLIIEAMVASPLIALGLAHPNSQQFLGASDQVLMMLLLVSLRPLLISIAIFFACVIGYLAIYFLNEGVLEVLESLGLFSTDDSPVLAIAILISSMLIYSYLAFMAVIQSFSVIGSLPDTIARWIGMGPMGGTSPLQQVFGVRDSFEAGARQALSGEKSIGRRSKNSGMAYFAVSAHQLAKTPPQRGISENDIQRYQSASGSDKEAIRNRLLAGLKKHDRAVASDVLDRDNWTNKEKADVLQEMRRTKNGGRIGRYTDEDGNHHYRFSSGTNRTEVAKLIHTYNHRHGTDVDANFRGINIQKQGEGVAMKHSFTENLAHGIQSAPLNPSQGVGAIVAGGTGLVISGVTQGLLWGARKLFRRGDDSSEG